VRHNNYASRLIIYISNLYIYIIYIIDLIIEHIYMPIPVGKCSIDL